MIPTRIQRKRVKGWKMPENTLNVTRPGKYGNPFQIGHYYKRGGDEDGEFLRLRVIYMEALGGHEDLGYTKITNRAQAVEWFRWYVATWSADRRAEAVEMLRGKDLACWCPIGKPCHADVLLELANLAEAPR